MALTFAPLFSMNKTIQHMFFITLFSITLFAAGFTLLSMLYMPINIEHPVDPDEPRIPTDKETMCNRLRFYCRELRAPENAMPRRIALFCLLTMVCTASLILHFVHGAENAADTWLMPSSQEPGMYENINNSNYNLITP